MTDKLSDWEIMKQSADTAEEKQKLRIKKVLFKKFAELIN